MLVGSQAKIILGTFGKFFGVEFDAVLNAKLNGR